MAVADDLADLLWQRIREGKRGAFDKGCEHLASERPRPTTPSRRYRTAMDEAREREQDWELRRCPCGARFVGESCGRCDREDAVRERHAG